MTKVSRSALFAIHIEVDDAILKNLRRSPEIIAEAMSVCANYWHDNFLPKHFDRGAKGRYGYADRSRKYLNSREKKGKPYLVLSGAMKAELTSNAAIKLRSKDVELRMHARVLNLVPNISQDNTALRVQQSNGRMYPNLKREVKAMVSDETQKLSEIVSRYMVRQYMAQGR